jgi:hypothetical protein
MRATQIASQTNGQRISGNGLELRADLISY